MFERFTDSARRATVLAQEEARSLRHGYIGTEHLLLGILHEMDGMGARALRSLGVDLDVARSTVLEIVGQGQAPPTGHIPFTPRAKKVLELSLREALQLSANYIGTEHILLGLIREGEGVAAEALARQSVDLSDVRSAVITSVQNAPPERPSFEDAPEVRLTEREMEVQRLLAEGKGHREIAAALFISENTVRNHVRNILEKLQHAPGLRRTERRPVTGGWQVSVGVAPSGEPVGPRCGGCGQDMTEWARTAVVSVSGPDDTKTDVNFLHCAHCGWILDVRWPAS